MRYACRWIVVISEAGINGLMKCVLMGCYAASAPNVHLRCAWCDKRKLRVQKLNRTAVSGLFQWCSHHLYPSWFWVFIILDSSLWFSILEWHRHRLLNPHIDDAVGTPSLHLAELSRQDQRPETGPNTEAYPVYFTPEFVDQGKDRFQLRFEICWYVLLCCYGWNEQETGFFGVSSFGFGGSNAWVQDWSVGMCAMLPWWMCQGSWWYLGSILRLVVTFQAVPHQTIHFGRLAMLTILLSICPKCRAQAGPRNTSHDDKMSFGVALKQMKQMKHFDTSAIFWVFCFTLESEFSVVVFGSVTLCSVAACWSPGCDRIYRCIDAFGSLTMPLPGLNFHKECIWSRYDMTWPMRILFNCWCFTPLSCFTVSLKTRRLLAMDPAYPLTCSNPFVGPAFFSNDKLKNPNPRTLKP